MLETTKTIIEIIALGTASTCVIDIMVKQARSKRSSKRQEELAKAKLAGYKQGQEDYYQEQLRQAEALKVARQRNQWHAIEEERAAMAKPANVIDMY